MVVASEVGSDMTRFPSDKHFASWLGLCPGTQIPPLRCPAFEQVVSGSVLPATVHPHGQRQGRHRCGPQALPAMLTKGEEYTDAGQDYFEERYRERVLRNLADRAKKLGMQITPMAQPA
jgi:transposase